MEYLTKLEEKTRQLAIGIAIGIAIEWPDWHGAHR